MSFCQIGQNQNSSYRKSNFYWENEGTGPQLGILKVEWYKKIQKEI